VRTALIDRIVALVLIPVLAPIIAVLAWRVRRADGGPPLIGLARAGRHGAPFTMWKLRSMRSERTDGSSGGAAITAAGDDRITPVGAMMRRWRLDELPQVWNVVRGDMGLLGPRPETPLLVDLEDRRWARVLAARPGITGPTQLVVEQWEAELLEQGSQEDTYRDEILPVKLAIDAWYVEQGTLLTDVQVAWSMLERFVLHRADTWVGRVVRTAVPEARIVPLEGASPSGAVSP
jgi:lipopolysaccharide/colanic/teichoic acid biosynthesis glycosyltransferase